LRSVLDTNIVSEMIRNPQGRVTARVQDVGEGQVATSIIVAAELRYGAVKKASARLTAQVEAVLGAIEILPFEEPADRVYGVLRAGLEQKGKPIGGNDLLMPPRRFPWDLRWSSRMSGSLERLPIFYCENWLG